MMQYYLAVVDIDSADVDSVDAGDAEVLVLQLLLLLNKCPSCY